MAKKSQSSEEASIEQIEHDIRSPGTTASRRRDHLLDRTKEELVDIILGFETVTGQPIGLARPGSLSFDTDAIVEHFIRLPADEADAPAGIAHNTWRVLLYSSDKAQQRPLGLELWADIVIGRRVVGTDVDLDLSALGALKSGVSRKHAVLRPTRSSLFLIDLGSSNGTFCNAVKLGNGVAQKLEHGDTVSFGHLHFKLKIAQTPEQYVANQ